MTDSGVKKLTFGNFFIDHKAVVLDIEEGKVNLAGNWYTPQEWSERARRVTEAMQKHGLLPLEPVMKSTRSHGSHPFLIGNLKYINSAKRGHIKKAPWWLRWLYEGVVSKDKLEEYG
ncbi:hypothetical protein CMI37_34825 [Candidatus Pacearchaeota archaeon]|nr:hypothetical protein [Candidatus Pacearchaeota archaeon]